MRARGCLALPLLALMACVARAAGEGAYLSPDRVPDGVAILPPPPQPGSAAARADVAIFNATRKLRGSPRWQIATDDVTNTPLERYACALGVALQPRDTPAVTRLLNRSGTGPLVDAVKSHYHTVRPFVGVQAPVCEATTTHLIDNPDYPSGHAANGWLEALILAALAPERATALLSRARAYGESRVVCGSHTRSAVEAGWMAGSATFAALEGDVGFRADLESARHELQAIMPGAAHPDAQRCAIERQTLLARPW